MLQNKTVTHVVFATLSSLTLYADSGLPQTSEPFHRAQPLKIEHPPFTKGELHVICGAMCAGKSEELIRLIGRHKLSGRNVLAIKPGIDNRKLLNNDKDPLKIIPSRTGSYVDCTPVKDIHEMEQLIQESSAQVIAIDEAHFFTPEQDLLVALVQKLIVLKKKVIVAGLELDFRGEPFGPMPKLLAIADQVEKLPAICSVCGDDTYCLSQRLVEGQPAHYNDPLIVVGAEEKYEARCRKCHQVDRTKRK